MEGRMVWNHRIIRKIVNDEEYFAIHEVYYEDDKPVMVTEEPIPVRAETIEDLQEIYEWFGQAFRAPVLDYDDF